MKRFFLAIFMFFFCTAICWGQNSGNAVQFDGVNDYIAIPEGIIQPSDHTYSIEVWVNVNVLSNASTGIVHHSAVGGEFIIEIDPDNNFEFGVHTPTGDSFGTWYKIQSPAAVDQWYHVVGVRENSVVRLYVDGVLADTMAITDDDQFVLPNYHSCIGAYNQESNYLNGQVDEVRFWNVALTQIQIQNSMTNLLTGTEEGLAAYWRFDEGSGTTSTDLTTNGYIGTLINDPAWVASTAPLVYDTPPAPPTGLNATAGDQQVMLSWGKNSETDFLRYFIYGGTSENPTTKIDSTSGGILDTVKAITNLVNGTTYYFRITAVDSAGNESDFSNEVSAKPVLCLFTEQTGISLAGAYYGSVDWGDYDNDGDLDILLTGTNDANLMTKIYTNNGDNSFSEKTDLNLPQVYTGTAVWGDYDNDGDLDILITGNDGNWPVASIYQNNGDGSFELKPATGLSGVTYSSAAWGDYDNDGDLDIIISGNRYDVEFPPNSSTIIYRNDGNAVFSRQSAICLGQVSYGPVAWGDYDNDGDLDVLLTGWNGSEYITKIYCNNSDNTFSERTNMGLIQAGDGAIDWGDYDNDGDLDILITGNEGDFITAKVYSNDGNGSFTEQTEISLQSVYYSSVAWGDYDNDGDLDILLTGSTGAASGSFWVTKIYNNNGNNSFSELSDITFTGICYSSVAWGDYDNDSDLDILMSGLSVNGPVTKIYRNGITTPNTLPAAPTGLAAVAWGDSVTLSWSKSTDNETPQDGLAYNIYVGTSPDSGQVKASMSDNITGYRRITQMGNTNQCNFHTLKGLAEDKYYWSVQAIDNCFTGSAWAGVNSFIIDLAPAAPQNLTATPGDRQVTLRWQANTEYDILCYYIYGDTTANPITKIDSITGGILDTVKTIIGLTNGITYYFRITAVDSADNESNYSEYVQVSPSFDLKTGLIAYYPFNGNANDESGNGNNGTVIGATLTADRNGNINSAYNFGNNQYINIGRPDDLEITGELTISAWVYYNAFDSYSGIVAKGLMYNGQELQGAYGIGVARSNRRIYFDLRTTSSTRRTAISQTELSTNTWYHIAGTFAPGIGLQVYLDGNLTGSSEFTDTVISHATLWNNNDVRIGDSQQSQCGQEYSGFLNGMIDDIRIYNHVLNKAEIDSLYRENIYFNHNYPSIPQNLRAIAGNGQVELRWGACPDSNISYYRIYCDTINNPTSFIDSTSMVTEDTAIVITGLTNGTTYYFRITAVNNLGYESGYSENIQAIPFNESNMTAVTIVPTKFELSQNHPNPFNPVTTIRYALPENSHVHLAIYNLNGQLIEKLMDEEKTPGYYSVLWNATRYSSGVYFYKLTAGDYVEIRKCVLIK